MRILKKLLKIAGYTFLGFFILGLIGSIFFPTEETTKESSKPAVTQEAKPEKTVKPVNPISQVKGKVIEEIGKDRNVKVKTYKGTIQVSFNLEDNLFSDSRIRAGQRDMTSILLVIKDLGITTDVFVEAWFPLVDKYGNTDMYSVMYIEVSPDTLNRMNLGTIYKMPDLLENAADSYYLHPAMR